MVAHADGLRAAVSYRGGAHTWAPRLGVPVPVAGRRLKTRVPELVKARLETVIGQLGRFPTLMEMNASDPGLGPAVSGTGGTTAWRAARRGRARAGRGPAGGRPSGGCGGGCDGRRQAGRVAHGGHGRAMRASPASCHQGPAQECCGTEHASSLGAEPLDMSAVHHLLSFRACRGGLRPLRERAYVVGFVGLVSHFDAR
jgi:hypothetical protein